jgi:hypothetical protein
MACPRKTAGEMPGDVDRLVNTVVELHIAKGLLDEVAVTIQDSMTQVYGENIVRDNGFTVEEFQEQMWLIRSEPEWMESFFTLVSDELSKMDAESSRVPPQLKNKVVEKEEEDEETADSLQ